MTRREIGIILDARGELDIVARAGRRAPRLGLARDLFRRPRTSERLH